VIEKLENTLKKAKKIVFLTGAGISLESGISTFRGKNGLWQKYDPIKLASAQAFKNDPKLVWSWYKKKTTVDVRYILLVMDSSSRTLPQTG